MRLRKIDLDEIQLANIGPAGVRITIPGVAEIAVKQVSSMAFSADKDCRRVYVTTSELSSKPVEEFVGVVFAPFKSPTAAYQYGLGGRQCPAIWTYRVSGKSVNVGDSVRALTGVACGRVGTVVLLAAKDPRVGGCGYVHDVEAV